MQQCWVLVESYLTPLRCILSPLKVCNQSFFQFLICAGFEKLTLFTFWDLTNHVILKLSLHFFQEAVVQYEQYEQEVRDLQGLIEEAHRVIQDRPIPTNNIQELQAQILHHEVQYFNSFTLPVFLLKKNRSLLCELVLYSACPSYWALYVTHNCYITSGCILYFWIGTCPKDQRLPGANRLTQLKMQNAGSEGQARHHAPDSDWCRGSAWGSPGDGWGEIKETCSSSCRGKRTSCTTKYTNMLTYSTV